MPESLSDGTDVEKSTVISEDGAYLFEAYLMRDIDKGDPTTYKTPFTATAQATFGNNGKQSEERKLSFQEAWTDPDMNIAPDQKEILDKFLAELGIKQTE